MHVKICGITNVDDALAAAQAGADLLGFNFYHRSPRYVEPETCTEIMCEVRGRGLVVQSVGVFVNATAAEAAEIADRCALDLLQLHGDEAPATLRALQMLGMRAFKALRPACAEEAEGLAARYPARAAAHGGLPGKAQAEGPAWLIDAYHPGLYGGTGSAGDWSAAAKLAAQAPILLAGGLKPENVAAAIKQVRPWGVDVASGVERAPGVKDHARVAAFVAAALRAEAMVNEGGS